MLEGDRQRKNQPLNGNVYCYGIYIPILNVKEATLYNPKHIATNAPEGDDGSNLVTLSSVLEHTMVQYMVYWSIVIIIFSNG